MADGIATILGRIIADERAALLGGDFAALAAIALRKEEALKQMARPRRQELPHLQSLVSELAVQQKLIQASLAGIRAARVRVAALKAAGQGTLSYGRDGSAHRIGADAPDFERRA